MLSEKRVKSLSELRISEAVAWTMELFSEAGCKSFTSLIAYHALLRMDPTGANTGRGVAQWYPFCSDAKWQQLKDFCKMSVDAFVIQILDADSKATGQPDAAQAVADAARASVETGGAAVAPEVSVQPQPLSEASVAIVDAAPAPDATPVVNVPAVPLPEATPAAVSVQAEPLPEAAAAAAAPSDMAWSG